MKLFHERPVKWHDISSIKQLWDLFGQKVGEWNDVNNFMDCIRIPVAVAQRLISGIMRHCVGACGV